MNDAMENWTVNLKPNSHLSYTVSCESKPFRAIYNIYTSDRCLHFTASTTLGQAEKDDFSLLKS